MLPDLPRFKEKLFKVEMNFVRWASREQMPVFGDAAQFPIFEGNRHGIERSTGDTEIRDFDKAGAKIITAPHKDNLGDTFAKLYDMGRQFAEETEKTSFKYLNETLEKHGQSVNAGGKKLTADVLLEAHEKIEFPLGEDGKIDRSGIRIVVSPDAAKNLMAAMQEIENSPEKSKKLEEILKRKEEAARAREADRKLVG